MNAFDQFALKGQAPLRSRIHPLGEFDAGGQYLTRLEAQRHTPQCEKALDQQPRACQQNHRDRKLGNHQTGTQTVHLRAGAARRRRLFERVVQGNVARLPRREETENQRGQRRHHERENQHTPVNGHGVNLGQPGRQE